MKTKFSKTSKTVGTKKAKTGSTKASDLTTFLPVSTRQTSFYVDLKVNDISSLKGISTDQLDGKWQQYVDLTKDATFEFCLRKTPFSLDGPVLAIRIGPGGMAIRMPSDEKFQRLGWPKPKKKAKVKKSDIIDLLDEYRDERF